ncbi:hypothetical protein FBR43_12705 [Sphingomonas baiyangensis]|uniref:ParB/Sulfiredoxin domain-containing protein n=1 Tax=Sphingomonas baiyangensis TaxID=2572576 RepID=A0A4U1L3P2_9SPHN|nr:ParB/Srx family N-terminal domain-containing protein [Sphingomonas baiyangensis]TKD51517.1 hypothetical protein FBR43_12705 [Sphingomonas baiyangensis]
MSNFDLLYMAPSELKPRDRAYRTHPESQMERLCGSIIAYGFNDPVGIDADNRIVSGAARVAAAERLGLNRIPVIRIDHLSPAKLRAYAIAVNKIAELAGYDESELALELGEIQSLLGDHELPELGLETAELDRLLSLGDDIAEEEVVDEPDPDRVISAVGSIWDLGRHAMLCGDALSRDSYVSLMGDERARYIISDLPYNLSTDTFSTTGRHSDFCQGAGELDSAQFTRFLTTAMRHMAAMSANGSIHMFFMSHHFLLELLRAGRIVYGDHKTIITWKKQFPGLGSWYRSQSEFIAAFKNGDAPYINNLGVHGRNRSTVWEYDGMAGFGRERDELLAANVSEAAPAHRRCDPRLQQARLDRPRPLCGIGHDPARRRADREESPSDGTRPALRRRGHPTLPQGDGYRTGAESYRRDAGRPGKPARGVGGKHEGEERWQRRVRGRKARTRQDRGTRPRSTDGSPGARPPIPRDGPHRGSARSPWRRSTRWLNSSSGSAV